MCSNVMRSRGHGSRQGAHLCILRSSTQLEIFAIHVGTHLWCESVSSRQVQLSSFSACRLLKSWGSRCASISKDGGSDAAYVFPGNNSNIYVPLRVVSKNIKERHTSVAMLFTTGFTLVTRGLTTIHWENNPRLGLCYQR
jgi:hypothetical protein